MSMRMKAILTVATLAGGALIGELHAQEKGDAMQPIATVEGVSEYVLDNGARILLYPDPSASSISVNMTVLVGSRHEGYGEAGMAHLLEHMLFKGTPLHPDVPKVLQDRGAQFNGTTWLDRTNYYETLPASGDNLEFAIRLEADRLVNSFVRGEDLQSEMTVVRNEFESGENSPQRVLMQRIQAAAFEWHNYGKSTIGNRSDIERVPITNLRDFYRRHYQPDNIVVIIGGKFESAEALKLVQKYFGVLDRPQRAKNSTYTEEPPQDGERTVVLRRVGDVKLVGAAYHVPASSHEDFAAVQVLAAVLGIEPAGRLYKDLVETKLATSSFSAAFETHDPGMLLVGCEVSKDDSIEAARAALLKSVERTGADVTDAEVDRAKQNLMKEREMVVKSVNGVVSQLSEWSARGDWRLFFLHRDRLEKVTAEEVRRVATAYLQRNNRTVGLFIPTDDAERVKVPARPSVADLVSDYQGREAVETGELLDPDPIAIQERIQYADVNGLRVALLPKKTRGNAVRMTLNLRYGDEASLQGSEAAIELLPRMITRGADGMSHDEFEQELDKYRANLRASGGRGLLTVSLEVQRENLGSAMELVRKAVRKPTLADDELEVVRRAAIASLEARQSEPRGLAMRSIRRSLSGRDPGDLRYVPTFEEDIARYRSTTIEQIRTLHGLLGSAGEVTLVGDFDPAEVLAALGALSKTWEPKVAYTRIDDPAVEVDPVKENILTPDKANAVYIAGLRFPMRDDHPDFAALTVGNFILGGGSLSSRLGDRVRQKEGLSYGVGSQLRSHPVDASTTFSIFAIVNPQNREKLTEVIHEELERFRKDGITAEELERATQSILESAKLERGQDAALAGVIASNLFAKRDLKFQRDFEARIEELSVEDVNTAWRKHIDWSRASEILAGDFEP